MVKTPSSLITILILRFILNEFISSWLGIIDLSHTLQWFSCLFIFWMVWPHPADIQCVVSYSPCFDWHAKIKWDDSLRDEFRRSLISRLTDLNSIVNHIEISDRNSINTRVENFSGVLNKVANPLFCKEVRTTRSKSATLSENKTCKKAEWFDDECRTAKQLFLNALNIFN